MKALIDVPDGTYLLEVNAFWHVMKQDKSFEGGVQALQFKLKEDDGQRIKTEEC